MYKCTYTQTTHVHMYVHVHKLMCLLAAVTLCMHLAMAIHTHTCMAYIHNVRPLSKLYSTHKSTLYWPQLASSSQCTHEINTFVCLHLAYLAYIEHAGILHYVAMHSIAHTRTHVPHIMGHLWFVCTHQQHMCSLVIHMASHLHQLASCHH